ncbi:hypothetical protein SAMN05661010_03244 [Modicisalibacter muralis]|uniref:Uncharacterized protein n=1 Tax=Modicisalibacter muralis TaxID=119000 RepID=A0A1G9Q6W3_9GAMM|nr:hypothetical protein [Halomonas muralis]SDM06792.1 hypothetical protein SAMN05661010_03244 [Halomonas muralis]
MTTEPQRSQYLEAMGFTAWVSRYRLPNAAPTQACEWLVPESVPAQPPAQRLHALLDDAEPASTSAREPSDRSLPSARHGASQAGRARARALLAAEGIAGEPDSEGVADSTPTAEQALASQASAALPAEKTAAVSLRFTLQIAALDGRWLILLPDHREPDTGALRLLGNLLQAARIVPGDAPAFQVFRWPMMEGQPVEAPLDEARDGLRAFVEGRRQRGWRPERLLVFGEDETLAPILELDNGHCRLLGIPGWQGPSLQELSQSATAKRELWPHLHGWRDAWHRTEDGEGDDDDPAA